MVKSGVCLVKLIVWLICEWSILRRVFVLCIWWLVDLVVVLVLVVDEFYLLLVMVGKLLILKGKWFCLLGGEEWLLVVNVN